MDQDSAVAAAATMFPQVDALPRAKREPPAEDRNGQAGLGQRRSHVRRHVIWAFRRMGPQGIAFGDQSTKERLEITADIRVGVLLDHQTCGRVLDEQGAQAIRHTGFGDVLGHFTGDFC